MRRRPYTRLLNVFAMTAALGANSVANGITNTEMASSRTARPTANT